MKLTIKHNNVIKEKEFGNVLIGDMFFELDHPDVPYLKTCSSHGDANGAGFNLSKLYEDEFEDMEIVGLYKEQEITVTV